jgi:hypothetical protein
LKEIQGFNRSISSSVEISKSFDKCQQNVEQFESIIENYKLILEKIQNNLQISSVQICNVLKEAFMKAKTNIEQNEANQMERFHFLNQNAVD